MMDHLAILKDKRWLEWILSEKKIIESRWSKFKRPPYGSITKGDTVYFKISGKMVTAKATVAKALFFNKLNHTKTEAILDKYGERIGVTRHWAAELAGKNFCTLVFLKDAQRIEPFSIDKKGYGSMTAWISITNIAKLIPPRSGMKDAKAESA